VVVVKNQEAQAAQATQVAQAATGAPVSWKSLLLI